MAGSSIIEAHFPSSSDPNFQPVQALQRNYCVPVPVPEFMAVSCGTPCSDENGFQWALKTLSALNPKDKFDPLAISNTGGLEPSVSLVSRSQDTRARRPVNVALLTIHDVCQHMVSVAADKPYYQELAQTRFAAKYFSWLGAVLPAGEARGKALKCMDQSAADVLNYCRLISNAVDVSLEGYHTCSSVHHYLRQVHQGTMPASPEIVRKMRGLCSKTAAAAHTVALNLEKLSDEIRDHRAALGKARKEERNTYAQLADVSKLSTSLIALSLLGTFAALGRGTLPFIPIGESEMARFAFAGTSVILSTTYGLGKHIASGRKEVAGKHSKIQEIADQTNRKMGKVENSIAKLAKLTEALQRTILSEIPESSVDGTEALTEWGNVAYLFQSFYTEARQIKNLMDHYGMNDYSGYEAVLGVDIFGTSRREITEP